MWLLSSIDFCRACAPSHLCLSVCTHDNCGSGLAAHPYASHHPRLRDHYKSLQLSACIHRHSLRSTFEQLSAHLIVRHASHPQQHHIPRTHIPCIGGCHGCDRRTADRVNRGCPAASCARALVHVTPTAAVTTMCVLWRCICIHTIATSSNTSRCLHYCRHPLRRLASSSCED